MLASRFVKQFEADAQSVRYMRCHSYNITIVAHVLDMCYITHVNLLLTSTALHMHLPHSTHYACIRFINLQYTHTYTSYTLLYIPTYSGRSIWPISPMYSSYSERYSAPGLISSRCLYTRMR